MLRVLADGEQAAVLRALTPITVTGDAYAQSRLRTLALSVNGGVVHRETWDTADATEDLWRFLLQPACPVEHLYDICIFYTYTERKR